MRNRFHKEPLNKENVIRPDQAGTKENPDYVVNIAGEWKKQQRTNNRRTVTIKLRLISERW